MKKSYYQKVYNVDTWINIHNRQLSYSRNLLLALSVAALGYTLNLFIRVGDPNHLFSVFVGCSILFFLAAIFFGLIIAGAEAENYGLYRKISRIIEQSNIDPDNELDENIFKPERDKCDEIEKKNRERSKIQRWLFFIGILIQAIGLAVIE